MASLLKIRNAPNFGYLNVMREAMALMQRQCITMPSLGPLSSTSSTTTTSDSTSAWKSARKLRALTTKKSYLWEM